MNFYVVLGLGCGPSLLILLIGLLARATRRKRVRRRTENFFDTLRGKLEVSGGPVRVVDEKGENILQPPPHDGYPGGPSRATVASVVAEAEDARRATVDQLFQLRQRHGKRMRISDYETVRALEDRVIELLDIAQRLAQLAVPELPSDEEWRSASSTSEARERYTARLATSTQTPDPGWKTCSPRCPCRIVSVPTPLAVSASDSIASFTYSEGKSK